MRTASTGTVRISALSYRTVARLASEERVSLRTMLDRVLEQERRTCFIEAVNQRFSALRADPVLWQAEAAERQAWSGDRGEE